MNDEFLHKTPLYIQDIAPPKKHDTQYTKPMQTLCELWEDFRGIKRQTEDEYSLDKIQQNIFADMVARDLLYQEMSRPGRPITDQVTPDGSNDPYASFVRRYILNGARTGNDAFDALHQSLVPVATQYQRLSISDQENTGDQKAARLIKLQNMWEKHHPGLRQS